MTIAITRTMTERGDAFIALSRELESLGPAKLHPQEKTTLTEAANARLFDEPEAETASEAASQLLDSLVESGRWLGDTATKVRELLLGCGA